MSFIPLILNLLKDGPSPFRPILPFPPTLPSFNKFRMSGKKGVDYPGGQPAG